MMSRKCMAIMAAVWSASGCLLLAEESSTNKPPVSTAELRKQVEWLRGQKGYNGLTIGRQGHDTGVSIAQDDLGVGEVSTYILVVYPFTDDPVAKLRGAGITFPAAWKLKPSEPGEVVFVVTGSDTKTIVEFVVQVFAKLLKFVPNEIERTLDTQPDH